MYPLLTIQKKYNQQLREELERRSVYGKQEINKKGEGRREKGEGSRKNEEEVDDEGIVLFYVSIHASVCTLI